jgi:hypothetical protein
MNTDWPIIIGGSHRSGTTLLRRLLNGHPRIYCPPEIKLHKDLLGQYPNDPLAHARLSTSIKALGLPTEIYLDEFGQALCRCFEIAARNAGKTRWADKNPENAINVDHWDRLLAGKMMFVLVVRHPLDVIASMHEIKMDKTISRETQGRAEHVLAYAACGLAFCTRHPDRSIVVRYEDLVAQPAEELKRLMSELGERYDASMIANLASGLHGQGVEDPKAAGRGEISAANVGRWRRDLSDEDLRTARPILAPLASQLGYALE